MSSHDFINQTLKKSKKNTVGFVEKDYVEEEHTHMSINMEDNYHYFGTAAYNDSISTQVGLFHPYHPSEDCLDKTMGFPSTPISFECPLEYKANLPVAIKELLCEHKASKICIRPFFQNMPWMKGTLLIRPQHILLSPHTEESKEQFKNGTFNGLCECKVGIFSTDNTITIDTTPPNTLTSTMCFTSHPSGSGYTLCSPGGYGVINGIDYNKTCTFYSVIVTNNEWFVTPVCLLNTQDFQTILKITSCEEIKTLLDLIAILDKEKFTMASILKELLAIKV